MVLLAVLGAPDASRAAWLSPGAGGHYARAITLAAGNAPSGSVANRAVTLSWTATNLPGGSPVAGYTVRRYTTGGTLQAIGSACSTTIVTTSCTESATPPGTWRYTVQPLQGNWAGAESAVSSNVTVAGPSLAIASGSPVAVPPATVTATLAGYAPGQTLTYRLDNASTGTLLAAATAPTTIPAGGGATATITIPAGTVGGSHTIYAIGSAGDTASAAITVDYTVTTGAWKISDLSSGSAVDASGETSVAADARTLVTGRWSSAFAATRYADFDMANPLSLGQSVTGANFNFRFAAEAAAQTACFYFDVRRISTGAVLATHGSAASPLGCVTGTTLQSFTTAVAELTTSDLADDARVRVYVSQTNNRSITVDLATLTGTVALTAFTLHAADWTDASTGTAANAAFPLAVADGTEYQIGTAWATTFNTARYLDVTFPAYVPAAATVRAVTLRHVQRPSSSGATACWYAEVWSGGVLIGSHGSSATPISCPTGAGSTTDSVSLPEVNTPARADDVTVRIFEKVNGSPNRRTQHDIVELSVRYG
ncbi:MAG: hypothetical protein QOE06_1248 [Thermoleophilaceae bacterium]|nr:hypothetical protein [Thermoleophilaceae bacterium]